MSTMKHVRDARYELNGLMASMGLQAVGLDQTGKHHKFLLTDAGGHVHHVAFSNSPRTDTIEYRLIMQRARRVAKDPRFALPPPRPPGTVVDISADSVQYHLPGLVGRTPDDTMDLRPLADGMMMAPLHVGIITLSSHDEQPSADEPSLPGETPTMTTTTKLRTPPERIVKCNFTQRLAVHDRLKQVRKYVPSPPVDQDRLRRLEALLLALCTRLGVTEAELLG